MPKVVSEPTQTWILQKTLEMADDQFERWCGLVEERTGIRLTKERESYLTTTLSMRMREAGFDSYDAYWKYLTAGKGREVEWAVLVDRLTVQETCFFRHSGSYQLIRDYCYKRINGLKEKRTFDVWSVGCATGEEPYSLAMAVDEQTSSQHKNIYWGVTATDISLPAIAKAKRGVYGERKLALMNPILRQRYFRKLGDSEYQVVPEIKNRVCFAQQNLLELGSSPLANLDIIFCQNVLIYFRRWRKKEIISHLAERLAPGGLMVLGLGEIVDWEHPEMERFNYPDTLAFTRKVQKVQKVQ